MSLPFKPYQDWNPDNPEDDGDVYEDSAEMARESFFDELEARGVYDDNMIDEKDIHLFIEPHWDDVDHLSDDDQPRKIGDPQLFHAIVEGSAAHIIRELQAWLEKHEGHDRLVYNFVSVDSSVGGYATPDDTLNNVRGIVAHWDHPLLVNDLPQFEPDAPRL